jgi:hypothetical protein
VEGMEGSAAGLLRMLRLPCVVQDSGPGCQPEAEAPTSGWTLAIRASGEGALDLFFCWLVLRPASPQSLPKAAKPSSQRALRRPLYILIVFIALHKTCPRHRDVARML